MAARPSSGPIHAEHAAEHRAVEQAARSAAAAGGLIVPGSARSVPSAIAGTRSVPRSIASTCMTTRGSGTAPPADPPDEERDQLADVRAEVVAGEAADVVVDRPALLDRGHDRGEVVVEQDQVGGLLGDLGAAPAHGDADVGVLEGRRVVDPVAGHRQHLAVGAQELRQAQLLLGVDAREDDVALGEPAAQLLRRRGRGQIGARDDVDVGRRRARCGGRSPRRSGRCRR